MVAIRRQCFLDAKTIRRTLSSVFRLCVALCNLVEKNEKDIGNVRQVDIDKIDSSIPGTVIICFLCYLE